MEMNNRIGLRAKLTQLCEIMSSMSCIEKFGTFSTQQPTTLANTAQHLLLLCKDRLLLGKGSLLFHPMVDFALVNVPIER